MLGFPLLYLEYCITKCQAVIDLSDESIQVHKFTSSIY